MGIDRHLSRLNLRRRTRSRARLLALENEMPDDLSTFNPARPSAMLPSNEAFSPPAPSATSASTQEAGTLASQILIHEDSMKKRRDRIHENERRRRLRRRINDALGPRRTA